MLSYYVAVFEKSADGFGVFFPEVPGCTSAGDTVAEAAKNATEALESHLSLSIEHGEPIPVPTGLVDMPVDADVEEVCRLLVGFEPSAKPIRVNITLPENLLAEVDRTAAADGFTRSGFLAQAARERLRRTEGAALATKYLGPATTIISGGVTASGSFEGATGFVEIGGIRHPLGGFILAK